MSGCGASGTPDDSAGGAAGSGPSPAGGPDSSDARGLAGAIAVLAGDSGRGAAEAVPGWPADFDSHPRSAVESREWLAVLHDRDGRVYGFRQRFDRFALPDAAPDAAPDAGRSDWRFGAVMRSDGAIEEASGERVAWRDVERVAVGIAEPALRPDGVRVLGASLSVDAAVDAPDGSPAGDCDLAWRLRVADRASLVARQGRCPRGAFAAGIAQASGGPLRMSGDLSIDGEPRAVSGVAWYRQLWGTLPATGGAIVFDRAVVTLGGIGTVELLRSKRRSGRGPADTSADLVETTGTRALEAVEWDLADGETGDGPGRSRLRVPALGIDVELRALVPPADPDRLESDGIERVWRGAVIASGSHVGAGFVEYRPTSGPETNSASPSSAES